MSNKMWMRNESIPFSSLTIAWTDAALYLDNIRFLLLLVFSEWSPWQSRTSDRLALQPSSLACSVFPSCHIWKGHFKTSLVPQHEERVENCLWWWWHRIWVMTGIYWQASGKLESQIWNWGKWEKNEQKWASGTTWRETSNQLKAK